MQKPVNCLTLYLSYKTTEINGDPIVYFLPGPGAARCYKQIWKVGMVGKVGKEGQIARVAVANSLPDFIAV